MRKSIVKVGYAPITSTPGEDDTYGSVVKFESEVSGGREFTAEANGDSTEIYADGITAFSLMDNNGYDCKLTLIDLIDDVQRDWLGNTVDETTHSVSEYANGERSPRFALLISESTTDGTGKTTVYYNCYVSKRPGASSKTYEGKFDPQFPVFEIAAIVRGFASVNWGDVSVQVLRGIGQGLVSGVWEIGSLIQQAANSLLDRVKNFMGIHSPSRLFRDEVGKYLALGLGEGFTATMKSVSANMAAAVPTDFNVAANMAVIKRATGYLGNGSGGTQKPSAPVFNQTVNNYSPKALSPAESARLTRNATRQMVLSAR